MKNFQFDDNRIVGPMGQYYATLLGASEQFKEFLLNAINQAEMPKEKQSIPDCLISKDHCEKKIDVCYGDCEEPVKRDPHGRWYITMGHPGFNAKLNNAHGYRSEKVARMVLKAHAAKGEAR